MTRLINADALHIYMFKSASERMDLSVEYMSGWNDAIDCIANQMPTVDAMPVVRCEHCAHKKNCQWYYYSGDDYGFCNWAMREEHEQID